MRLYMSLGDVRIHDGVLDMYRCPDCCATIAVRSGSGGHDYVGTDGRPEPIARHDDYHDRASA